MENISRGLRTLVPDGRMSALKASGFRTAAFVSSIVVSSQSGLGRGFDTTRTIPTSRPFGMAAGAGRILREEEEDR